jgi:hypothetical protein
VDRILMVVPFGPCVLLVSWSLISCREMLFGEEVLMPKTIVSFSVLGILEEFTNILMRECTKI